MTGPHAARLLITLSSLVSPNSCIITSSRPGATAHLRTLLQWSSLKVWPVHVWPFGEYRGKVGIDLHTQNWSRAMTGNSSLSSHTGVHTKEGGAESDSLFSETWAFSPQRPGDSGHHQTPWLPLPLKCDRWAEFSWQLKHFALICVLVCILFWKTNFKRSLACRPSKPTGALSSFWTGRSSDSRQAAAQRSCCQGPRPSQLGENSALGLIKVRWRGQFPTLTLTAPGRRLGRWALGFFTFPEVKRLCLTTSPHMWKLRQAPWNGKRCKTALSSQCWDTTSQMETLLRTRHFPSYLPSVYT